MAIKLKRNAIDITNELNKELELYGFQIDFNPDKKEDKKDKKKEDKKTTKKMKWTPNSSQ